MVSTRIRRSLLVALFAAILVTLPAATALAANPGKTFTFHNQVDTFVDVLPCTDIPYQITTTSNGVMHFQLRTLPDGTVVAQFTFTQTGTFTAVPVSGVGPTFTGTFTRTPSVPPTSSSRTAAPPRSQLASSRCSVVRPAAPLPTAPMSGGGARDAPHFSGPRNPSARPAPSRSSSRSSGRAARGGIVDRCAERLLQWSPIRVLAAALPLERPSPMAARSTRSRAGTPAVSSYIRIGPASW